MNSIDLIPNEYRTFVAQRRLVQRYSVAFLAAILIVVAGWLYLTQEVARADAQAADMRRANAISQQQQQQLEQLRTQRADFGRQWSLLRGLRAGAEVEDIFEIVDRSLVGDELWFNEWSFRRAGVIIDGEQRGVETGYFIIVSPEDEQRSAALEVETHMSISGQARDHAALSRFVRNLFEQPDIRDVSVQKTSRARLGNQRVVDFDITIILNSRPRSG